MIEIPKKLLRRAIQMQQEVEDRMLGRMGDPGVPIAALNACFTVMAGDGDCCEIGVLWGGSAMTTALLRKEMGILGNVVCVDPFDGYYPDNSRYVSNENLVAPISLGTLMDNAMEFGVRNVIEGFACRSQPWPSPLADRKFVSAFIDGDHWGDVPFLDFMSLKDRTSRYITFDNVQDGSENGSDDVSIAIEKAFALQEGWVKIYESGRLVTLEKRVRDKMQT